MAALLVAHHDTVTELGKVKNYDFVYSCVPSWGAELSRLLMAILSFSEPLKYAVQ